MKLGVLTNLFGDRPLAEACDYFKTLGVEALEIGCGGYPGRDHCDPDVLLHDDAALEAFKNTIASRGLEISCLSVHGNPVHPNKEIAAGYHSDFEKAVLLCEKLGLDTLVTFSGCPGDHEGAKYPNWVTCPWPEDFLAILEWQWNEVLIPYWKQAVAFAEAHGVKRIALEMHPGFCVYNPETLLKLREAVGPVIGANFDPSH
ncbi:MAG: sugar phosphate isomerase/epimerase, partial [Clostridia bacterium]|nr:sugar phosphate isomerase/epimerase [Clostridia bacterium]